MNFYWLDTFIIGFILLLGLKGILNRLSREIFGPLGIMSGVLVASKYVSDGASFIQNTSYRIENESLASFAGFLAILTVFWIVCLLLGNLLAKLVKLSGLGFLDKIGCFLFDGAKVFLIFAILIFHVARINFLDDKLENFARDSYTLNLLKNTGTFIINQPLAKQNLEEAQQNLKESIENISNGAQGQ